MLVAGPKRNFQVFDPLDFLAEVTQHIPTGEGPDSLLRIGVRTSWRLWRSRVLRVLLLVQRTSHL